MNNINNENANETNKQEKTNEQIGLEKEKATSQQSDEENVFTEQNNEKSSEKTLKNIVLTAKNAEKENNCNTTLAKPTKKEHSLMFKVGLLYFIMLVCFVGFKIANYYGVFNGIGGIAKEIFSSSIIQILIMFLMPIIFVSIFKKQKVSNTFKDFKFSKVKWSVVCLAFILGIIVFVLNGYISTFFGAIINLFGYETLPSGAGSQTASYDWLYFAVTVLCSCILPAVCEETAHRGMLLSTYEKIGAKKAILISGLLFGLMHLNINQFFIATLIGSFLGFLTLLCRSILPAMIIHFTNNFLIKLQEFATANGFISFNMSTLFDYLKETFGILVAGFSSALLLFGVIALGLFIVYKIYEKQTFPLVVRKIVVNNVSYFSAYPDFDYINVTNNKQALTAFFGSTNHTLESIKYVNAYRTINGQPHSPISTAFIVGTAVAGSLITIFTFVWGLL